jgi:hypothetical protein
MNAECYWKFRTVDRPAVAERNPPLQAPVDEWIFFAVRI